MITTHSNDPLILTLRAVCQSSCRSREHPASNYKKIPNPALVKSALHSNAQSHPKKKKFRRVITTPHSSSFEVYSLLCAYCAGRAPAGRPGCGPARRPLLMSK